MMRFSIVIPMFNNQSTIVKTLESCIAQIYMPLEVIIVDDASQDNTVLTVEEWIANYNGAVKIELIKLSENSGPSKARNVGWNSAKGDFVAFLDADDVFLPGKLDKIETVLSGNTDMILLGHKARVQGVTADESNKLEKVSCRDLLKRNLFTTPSVVIKREIDERFDESMRYTEDHDLWLRVTQKYDESYYLDTVLSEIDRPVRAKGGQSANLWAMRKGEIKMYYKYTRNTHQLFLFPFFLLFSLSKHIVKKIESSITN